MLLQLQPYILIERQIVPIILDEVLHGLITLHIHAVNAALRQTPARAISLEARQLVVDLVELKGRVAWVPEHPGARGVVFWYRGTAERTEEDLF